MHRWLLAVAVLGATPAFAQEVALPEPVTAPASGKEGEPEVALDVDREIDLANVVTSAAKGVTTVQEAPAIITIITADEIKQRGFRWINQALSTIPGWIETSGVGSQIPSMMVRGVAQAQLELHDGISLFDPWGNNPGMLIPTVPLENIKRIEVVTGPGGVLWGANSFLGVINVISKDADDVNGLEVSAGYGDGDGWKQDFRAYAMFGKSFLKGKLKIFQHVSFESYLGTTLNLPQLFAASPAPQPGGPAYYGRTLSPPVDRSWLVYVDGKYSFGPVSLYYSIPVGENHPQLTFNNTIVPNDTWSQYNRYVILEYKDRFLKDRLGLTAKAYWTQFVRDYDVELFPPSTLFPAFTEENGKKNPGGFNFDFRGMLIQRTGATVDMDVNLPFNIRLLYGGEFFWEGMSNSIDHFKSPNYGVDANGMMHSPGDLPIYCPVDATGKLVSQCPRTFINDSSRYVGALYIDAQWRPVQKLALDAGVRIQKGFGQWGYDWTPLGSAAVVWNFLPDFHLKANYATGFRPPVFISLAAEPGGVQYGANPHLQNEKSQSFQGELNARVLKNVRKVRELELRIDYSYTYLQDLIQIQNGAYLNRGTRAIHSVEGYGKLYLAGDHFLQASYTFLYSTASDQGVIRNVPQNWFSFGASFNLIKDMLDVNMNLNVLGAYKDPDRYVSGQSPLLNESAGTQARTTDLTFDRLTPVALLQLGARARFFKQRLWISAQFYNVLNQHFYWPDFFNDLTPTTEMMPNPAPGFNFFMNVGYHP